MSSKGEYFHLDSQWMVIDLTSIRFAASPTGALRWQAPQAPVKNNDPILDANAFGAACPHSLRAGQVGRVLPSPISEDCLFLNVYAPTNASGLPVLVHIHGGGYGVGDGRQDLTDLINANNNTFIGVSIQYRVSPPSFILDEHAYANTARSFRLPRQRRGG